jgi:hypothetical protein
MPDDFMIRRTPTHASPDAALRLRVRRDVGARRQCSYTVGTDSLAIELAWMYGLIPRIPDAIWFSLVTQRWSEIHPSRDAAHLKGLLSILARHELVALSSADDGSPD